MSTPAPLSLPAPAFTTGTRFSTGPCSTAVIGVALALVLSACGQKPATSPAAPAATAGQPAAAPVLDTDEEKVLNVYNWSDYIDP